MGTNLIPATVSFYRERRKKISQSLSLSCTHCTDILNVHAILEIWLSEMLLQKQEHLTFNILRYYKSYKCLKACIGFNPVIIDKTKKSVVIQITALRREIDKMNSKLKPLGLISTSRTGAIAMTRGADIFN